MEIQDIGVYDCIGSLMIDRERILSANPSIVVIYDILVASWEFGPGNDTYSNPNEIEALETGDISNKSPVDLNCRYSQVLCSKSN